MPNYGDVRLGLPADWSRNQYDQPEWMFLTIGHENGKPDVYLKDDPDAEHQFYWVDPTNRHTNEIAVANSRGYVMVKQGEWEKHEYLWNWDAEGRLVHNGLVLMARPKAKFLEDEARKNRNVARATEHVDTEVADVPDGMVALGDDGQPLKRVSRKRGI